MKRIHVIKAVVWAACLAPLGILAIEALQGRLGANPIERITHHTGFWGLTLLVATLAITPIRRLTRWNATRLRRLLGLFGFFYICLHFATYVVLDHFFHWETIVEDILKRPYITVGFTAFVLLIPLAVTSTRGWIRRLGRRWQLLHRLVYVSAGLGVLHFFWKEKADTREPVIFAFVLAGLLAVRIVPAIRRRFAPRSPPRPERSVLPDTAGT